jgi:hypothetical protein
MVIPLNRRAFLGWSALAAAGAPALAQAELVAWPGHGLAEAPPRRPWPWPWPAPGPGDPTTRYALLPAIGINTADECWVSVRCDWIDGAWSPRVPQSWMRQA